MMKKNKEMKRNMKEKSERILAVLSMLLVSGIVLSAPAMAYDSGTPYTVTMQFVVASDTSFTVALAGSETTIHFNPATRNSTGVEPGSQVAASSTAMAVITNTGNVNQNYSINLTAAKPSWVVLKASSANSYAGASTFETTALSLAGWDNIATSGTAPVYLWADFTNAVGGTTSKTFQINTVQS